MREIKKGRTAHISVLLKFLTVICSEGKKGKCKEYKETETHKRNKEIRKDR